MNFLLDVMAEILSLCGVGVLILLRLSGCGGGIWIGLWAGPTILTGSCLSFILFKRQIYSFRS